MNPKASRGLNMEIAQYNLKFEEIESLLKEVDEKEVFDQLVNTAGEISGRNFRRTVHCYFPGGKFPPVSITGTWCALNCKHCEKHYLKHMIPAPTPSKLLEICLKLHEKGARGVLISGGYAKNGYVPLENFVDVLKQVKRETNLIINVHTGLIPLKLAEKLAKAEIDYVSIDIVGNTSTIKEIYQINKTPKDYQKALKNLEEAGIKRIAPHICIGLHYGKIKHELNALKIISTIKPSTIVLIALKPTPKTPIQNVQPPTPQTIAAITAITRILFPKTPIALGCMIPGGKQKTKAQILAVKAGANKLTTPTHQTQKQLTKQKYKLKYHETCCVVQF